MFVLRMKTVILLLGFLLIFSRCKNTIPDTEITIDIKDGMATTAIARLLKDNKIIDSKTVFIVWVKLKGYEKSLNVGRYKFSENMPFNQIIKLMKQANAGVVKILIPEGFSSFEIAEKLEQAGFGKKEKYLEIINNQKLEGYLFPDTYFFNHKMTEQQILDEMRRNFDAKFNPIFDEAVLKRALQLGKSEIIILASLIEKEAKLDVERPMISSVIYNRLKKGQYLQLCATVEYVYQMKFGNRKSRLFFQDLKIKSPYNTYRQKGLPIGPICSPGLASLKAAIYPADTKYYFYVKNKNNDGSHIFSKEFNEHIRAKKGIKTKL